MIRLGLNFEYINGENQHYRSFTSLCIEMGIGLTQVLDPLIPQSVIRLRERTSDDEICFLLKD